MASQRFLMFAWLCLCAVPAPLRAQAAVEPDARLHHLHQAFEPHSMSCVLDAARPATAEAPGVEPSADPAPATSGQQAARAIARARQGLPAYPKIIEAAGSGGAVATGHPLATHAAMRVMREGGSAMDAAVAAALTLGVAEPYHAGLGGGGFAVVWRAEDKSAEMVDFRERAPQAIPKDGYAAMPRRRGCTAVAIPGAVAGLWALHQGGGRLPWHRLFAEAIEAASAGVVVGGLTAARLKERRAALLEDPAAAAVFLPGGRTPRQGDVLTQMDLAATLRLLARDGPAAFYGGPVAQAIVAGCAARGGLMSEEDFLAYHARVGPAASAGVGNQVLHTVGPPSIGGLQVLQLYRMARAMPLQAPYGRPQNMHLLAEAMRLSFSVRTAHAADGERSMVPLGLFMDDAPVALAVGQISARHRIPLDALAAAKPLDGGTTHVSVVDGAGNAVALTMTINFRFGAAVVGPGTGVLLNDTMDDFSPPSGQSNLYMLSDGPLNSPAPGAPPLSSMSPTVVVQDGSPVLVLGGVGGPMIPTSVAQVLVNRFVYGMGLRSAVGVPRIHHQLLPDRVAYEGRHLSDGARKFMEQRGHRLSSVRNIGTVYAVELTPGGGRVAVADVRSHGSASVEIPLASGVAALQPPSR